MEANTNKLSFNKTQTALEINISASISKKKYTLLWVWLLLWTLCGMIVFSQFFVNHGQQTKIFMFVWFIFWIYFEYKIVFAYMWRKGGKEIIKLNRDGISIKRDINGNGKEKFYTKESIDNFKIVDFGSKNIALHMNTSFWAIGGETLKFESNGKQVAFGMQLTELEAKEVYKQIKFILR